MQSSTELSKKAELYRSVRGVTSPQPYWWRLPEPGRRQRIDLLGGTGSMVKGQRSATRLPCDPWRGGTVRRALYLAALSRSGSKTAPWVAYRQLRQRGKAGKVAMVAVMRKLLLIGDSLGRESRVSRLIPLDMKHRYRHPRESPDILLPVHPEPVEGLR